ncbi:TIM barrel protein [Labrys wisconsinensis]|uniref:2-keto-myo-inositol isomerase n=1 Tax=Labrys wisconsinensis TaxID=425677 RepID=A0ABU0IYR7_9HYPH|nr:TIM barrel protein [Labrys wisconsinensis]MDQ0467153.1 2-keto-myo-inositol isomerase [Labrys wisconsinensis]
MTDGTAPTFALNHMAAPRLGLGAFFELAGALGISRIEIRNDLEGHSIPDGTPAARVRALAEAAGLTILSINALQRFNEWTPDRAAEAEALADYAAGCGAEALVLVPVNDGTGRANGERQANLRVALKALEPILAERSLIGLVEPLGFESCSLRLKLEAVATIDSIGAGETFRLVHDTFHHHLAGAAEIFPRRTGLVHISGVTASVGMAGLRDSHRALVDGADRIGNLAQIRALIDGGYRGAFSFEPFAEAVHALADPAAAIRASMDFIRAQILRHAA